MKMESPLVRDEFKVFKKKVKSPTAINATFRQDDQSVRLRASDSEKIYQIPKEHFADDMQPLFDTTDTLRGNSPETVSSISLSGDTFSHSQTTTGQRTYPFHWREDVHHRRSRIIRELAEETKDRQGYTVLNNLKNRFNPPSLGYEKRIENILYPQEFQEYLDGLSEGKKEDQENALFDYAEGVLSKLKETESGHIGISYDHAYVGTMLATGAASLLNLPALLERGFWAQMRNARNLLVAPTLVAETATMKSEIENCLEVVFGQYIDKMLPKQPPPQSAEQSSLRRRGEHPMVLEPAPIPTQGSSVVPSTAFATQPAESSATEQEADTAVDKPFKGIYREGNDVAQSWTQLSGAVSYNSGGRLTVVPENEVLPDRGDDVYFLPKGQGNRLRIPRQTVERVLKQSAATEVKKAFNSNREVPVNSLNVRDGNLSQLKINLAAIKRDLISPQGR
jgi:hypothetical protein